MFQVEESKGRVTEGGGSSVDDHAISEWTLQERIGELVIERRQILYEAAVPDSEDD